MLLNSVPEIAIVTPAAYMAPPYKVDVPPQDVEQSAGSERVQTANKLPLTKSPAWLLINELS